MLHFDRLKVLDKHYDYLQKKLNNNSVFLVGGCIRDLLLGIANEPNDIDVTLAGKPSDIDKKIDKKNISYFMTEKFGTMTLIPKDGKNIEKLKNGDIEILKYEVTPFRTEGKYDDFRHPGEIEWVNDLLLDSNRREFTISCLYFFKLSNKSPVRWPKSRALLSVVTDIPFIKGDSSNITDKQLKEFTFDVQIKTLEKLGFSVFDENVFVIQNQEFIGKLFKEGKFQSDFFLELSKNFNEYMQNNLIDFMYNPEQIRIVIDPHKGLNDLVNGNLKAVGNPDNRFKEDALRIIRAVRFVNVINYKMERLKDEKSVKSSENQCNPWLDFEKNTWNALKKNYYLLQFVAKERIKDELVKVFKKGNPFGFISLLDELNLLKILFPALYLTKNINQPVRYHPFDVYTHTMLSLYELQKINSDYLTRFGMLYHDVGKVDQYYVHSLGIDREEIKNTLGTWLNHQKGGIDIARKDFQALGFSNKEVEEICRYIQMHHKPGEILDAEPKNRSKRVRKLLSEAGYQKFNNLIDICIADRHGQYNPIQSNNIDEVLGLRKLLDEINQQEGQFTTKDMKINGNEIMEYFKLPAGPKIGELMKKAFDRVINNIKERNDKKIILKHLKELV